VKECNYCNLDICKRLQVCSFCVLKVTLKTSTNPNPASGKMWTCGSAMSELVKCGRNLRLSRIFVFDRLAAKPKNLRLLFGYSEKFGAAASGCGWGFYNRRWRSLHMGTAMRSRTHDGRIQGGVLRPWTPWWASPGRSPEALNPMDIAKHPKVIRPSIWKIHTLQTASRRPTCMRTAYWKSI